MGAGEREAWSVVRNQVVKDPSEWTSGSETTVCRFHIMMLREQVLRSDNTSATHSASLSFSLFTHNMERTIPTSLTQHEDENQYVKATCSEKWWLQGTPFLKCKMLSLERRVKNFRLGTDIVAQQVWHHLWHSYIISKCCCESWLLYFWPSSLLMVLGMQ